MLRPFRGQRPQLASGAWVDDAAVVIGAVQLGEDSSVWPCAVVRGDLGQTIRIGARSNVQDNATLHISHAGPYNPSGGDLCIGDDVTVGHGATLHACSVGNRVLIGMGAIVLDGAVIEDDCFIAAGTLVPPGKRLAAGQLYRGNPAQPARPLSDREREQLLYMAANYVRLKNEYLAEAAAASDSAPSAQPGLR